MKSLFNRCLNASYTHTAENGDYATELEGDTLYLLFEKSDGEEDWKNNFKFLAVPWMPYKRMEKPWLCHRGFLKVWKSIEPFIEEKIRNPEVKKIVIVGYSHGAALALLCYEYVKYHRPDVETEGFGFGCPRVFWGVVPEEVKERFEGFKVIRNGNDIVTHVPPAVLGFRHVAEVVKIGQTNPVKDHYPEKYIHNLTEAPKTE